MNGSRHITRILRDVAAERGLRCKTLSQDWIIQLSEGSRTRWVFGYDFDLNSCCAQQLCKDKAGTSLLLHDAGIPRIEHVMFNHPQLRSLVPESGTWASITACATRFGFDVVCKPNAGSGGADVTRVRTQIELEDAVQKLFARERAIALAPFVDILDEYRIIVLQGEPLLSYRKVRPHVVGDGVSSRLELSAQMLRPASGGVSAARALADLARQNCDLSVVVPKGERWNVNWKHNLGLGAKVELLDPAGSEIRAAQALAVPAAAALGLTFGSVDVVRVAPTPRTDSPWQVLELNAGVMMESLAGESSAGLKLAAGVYRAAVDAMFA